jgi:hypothetical protein
VIIIFVMSFGNNFNRGLGDGLGMGVGFAVATNPGVAQAYMASQTVIAIVVCITILIIISGAVYSNYNVASGTSAMTSAAIGISAASETGAPKPPLPNTSNTEVKGCSGTKVGVGCYADCPTDYTPSASDPSICVGKGTFITPSSTPGSCSGGLTLNGNLCVGTCPAGDSYDPDSNSCVKPCPMNSSLSDTGQCTDKVGNTSNRPLDGMPLVANPTCSAGSSLYKGNCYQPCPDGYANAYSDLSVCYKVISGKIQGNQIDRPLVK